MPKEINIHFILMFCKEKFDNQEKNQYKIYGCDLNYLLSAFEVIFKKICHKKFWQFCFCLKIYSII